MSEPFEKYQGTIDLNKVVPLSYDQRDTDRLTVTYKFIHHHFGEQPVGLEDHFVTKLETVDQVYTRRFSIGEEAEELDIGRVERPERIVIENRTGKNLKVVPTPEEKAITDASVLQVFWGKIREVENKIGGERVAILGKVFPVKPYGRMITFDLPEDYLDSDIRLYLRSVSGLITARISVYPR